MADDIQDDGPLEPLLQGVRVLDFGRCIAGPFCAAMLVLLCHKVRRRFTALQCGQCPRAPASATLRRKRSVVIESAT